MTNDFEIHIIEMKKAKKILKDNKDDKIAQWMSFFDNPNSVEVRKMSEENEDINEALEQLRRLSSNRELVELMDRQDRYERDRRAEIQYLVEEGLEQGVQKGLQKGLQQGLEQGLERGKKEKSIEIAKKMKEQNIEIDVISKVTGLTVEEVKDLK